jgi:antitoxin YefM
LITIKTVDLRKDIKRIGELVNKGEKVVISRPHNENLVIISEKEYNMMEKAWLGKDDPEELQ